MSLEKELNFILNDMLTDPLHTVWVTIHPCYGFQSKGLKLLNESLLSPFPIHVQKTERMIFNTINSLKISESLRKQKNCVAKPEE